MAIPILLITGFLGVGKTTLISRILTEAHGRRWAAVVNDFGAINIDAALLGTVSDDVINLKNGCICCSLAGDLLQTLTNIILRRTSRPDGIMIETSGVSNPAEIVRALLDPVIWKEAALETIICVVDARTVTDQPSLREDSLWQSQVAASDFVALSKIDLVNGAERDNLRADLHVHKNEHAIHDMIDGSLPPELYVSGDWHRSPSAPRDGSTGSSPDFQTMAWTSSSPLVLSRFQQVVGQLSRSVIRAKGFVTFVERPHDPMLFQLVGSRATISRAPAGIVTDAAAQLVFIARRGALDEFALTASLKSCCISRAT